MDTASAATAKFSYRPSGQVRTLTKQNISVKGSNVRLDPSSIHLSFSVCRSLRVIAHNVMHVKLAFTV